MGTPLRIHNDRWCTLCLRDVPHLLYILLSDFVLNREIWQRQINMEISSVNTLNLSTVFTFKLCHFKNIFSDYIPSSSFR